MCYGASVLFNNFRLSELRFNIIESNSTVLSTDCADGVIRGEFDDRDSFTCLTVLGLGHWSKGCVNNEKISISHTDGYQSTSIVIGNCISSALESCISLLSSCLDIPDT